MTGSENDLFLLLLIVGTVLVLNVFLKPRLKEYGVPSLVVFLLLGIGCSLTNGVWHWKTPVMAEGLHVFSQLGVIALLFHVGLDSNLSGLLEKLTDAIWVWAGNVAVPLAIGFGTTFYLLGFGVIPSLIVGVAFSATSVGITASVWEETNQLNTSDGELFVDVAELDDLSAVLLMVLLFAILPELRTGQEISTGALLWPLGSFFIKITLFGTGCVLFSLYLEEPIMNVVARNDTGSELLLCMVGISFVIAATAEALGFSLAIGALFAGLVFSRDPQMVREDARFQILYDFFTPFFFLVIGLSVAPDLSGLSPVAIALLLVAAVASKFLGAGLPAWGIGGRTTGLLLGMSMVPRAEIFLIILKKGFEAGTWAVPDELYTTMVIVSLGSCLVGALALRRLLT
jgi:Kef-type K+ transport system membrane component KefB